MTMENVKNELITVDVKSLINLFNGGQIDPVIDEISKRADDFISTQDLTTKSGRDDTRSFAYKIARSKTLLEEAAKLCAEPFEEKLSKIKNERKRIKLKLEFLQNEVRNPLTEWEEKDSLRVLELNNKLSKIGGYKGWYTDHSYNIINRAANLKKYYDSTDFEERKKEAHDLYIEAGRFLKEAATEAVKRENKESEEKRLREQEAERLKAAEEENEKLRFSLEEEKRKKQDAIDKERKAQEKLLHEEKLKIEAQQRERLTKEASELKAKVAVDKERKRVQDEAEAAHQREELRKSEEAHREKIHDEIYIYLQQYCGDNAGLSTRYIKNLLQIIFNDIRDNSIPHVKIVY